jgi:hypothetical protein
MFGEVLPEEHLAYDTASPLVFGNYKMKQPNQQAKSSGSSLGQTELNSQP